MRGPQPRRSPVMILVAVLTGGVFGSVLSYFLNGLFPEGPVRRFFFEHLEIGLAPTALKLGFITLTFGLSFMLTAFTVLLIILFIWLVGKL